MDAILSQLHEKPFVIICKYSNLHLEGMIFIEDGTAYLLSNETFLNYGPSKYNNYKFSCPLVGYVIHNYMFMSKWTYAYGVTFNGMYVLLNGEWVDILKLLNDRYKFIKLSNYLLLEVAYFINEFLVVIRDEVQPCRSHCKECHLYNERKCRILFNTDHRIRIFNPLDLYSDGSEICPCIEQSVISNSLFIILLIKIRLNEI